MNCGSCTELLAAACLAIDITRACGPVTHALSFQQVCHNPGEMKTCADEAGGGHSHGRQGGCSHLRYFGKQAVALPEDLLHLGEAHFAA